MLLRDSYYVGWRDGEHTEVLVVKRAGNAYLLPRRPPPTTDHESRFDWGTNSRRSLYLSFCILCDFLQSLTAAERYRVAFSHEEIRLLGGPCFVMAGTDVQEFLTRQQLRAVATLRMPAQDGEQQNGK